MFLYRSRSVSYTHLVCIATDGNGADMVSDNSDYEWFSVAFEYSDRNANYAVPMFTWNFCYKLNKQANDILATIPADTENQTLIYYRGQALDVYKRQRTT